MPNEPPLWPRSSAQAGLRRKQLEPFQQNRLTTTVVGVGVHVSGRAYHLAGVGAQCLASTRAGVLARPLGRRE